MDDVGALMEQFVRHWLNGGHVWYNVETDIFWDHIRQTTTFAVRLQDLHGKRCRRSGCPEVHGISEKFKKKTMRIQEIMIDVKCNVS